MNYRHSLRGVTLPELLCALAVVAIATATGVPAFGQLVARNRLAITTNDLQSAMTAARTLAVARNVAVTFCAGSSQTGCRGDWSLGEWIVFVDKAGIGRLDSGESVHSSGRVRLSAGFSLQGNGPFRKAIVFRPTGLARTTSGAFAAGRLRICVTRSITPNANDLVLIGSGRAVLESHDFGAACPLP